MPIDNQSTVGEPRFGLTCYPYIQCQHVIHNNSFSDLVYRQFAFVVASLNTSLCSVIGATINTINQAYNYLIRTIKKRLVVFCKSLQHTQMHARTHGVMLYKLADVFSKYNQDNDRHSELLRTSFEAIIFVVMVTKRAMQRMTQNTKSSFI